MESWPADLRDTLTSLPDGEGQAKDTPVERHHLRKDAPTLQPGALGAATLVSENGRLRWKFASTRRWSTKDRSQPTSRTQKIFPETSASSPLAPQVTPHQRVEQGVRFLREIYPDVDFPTEIIQPLVMEEHLSSERSPLFDPYVGNCMAGLLPSNRNNLDDSGFASLVFSGNETGNVLYMVPFVDRDTRSSDLAQSAAPVKQFASPINQIQLLDNSHPLLIVRTLDELHVIDLRPRPDIEDQQKPNWNSIGRLNFHGAGLKRAMDIATNPFGTGETGTTRVAIVTGDGSISIWSGCDHLSQVPTKTLPRSSEKPSLQRITWGSTADALYHGTDSCLSLFDLRSQQTTQNKALALTAADGVLNSVASPFKGILCLCTTKKLFWIDERMLGRPVLSWVHMREEDRALQAICCDSGEEGRPFTALLSAANPLVSLYNVFQVSSNHPAQSHNLPLVCQTSASSTVTQFNPRRGFYFNPRSSSDHTIDFFELSARRAVLKTSFRFASCLEDGGVLEHPDREGPDWPTEVKNLQDLADERERDKVMLGPLRARESETMDFREAYNYLFLHPTLEVEDIAGTDEETTKQRSSSLNSADIVLRTFGNMGSFWEDEDIPTEHMLTTQDIAIQSGPGSRRPTHSSILSKSPINNPQGRSVLANKDERHTLPKTKLAHGSAFHFDARRTMSILCPAGVPFPLPDDELDGDVFEACEVRHGSSTDGAIFGKEEDARIELALDLALSMDVYSRNPFQNTTPSSSAQPGHTTDIEETTALMSRATLSAGVQPPVQYGFFQPAPRSLDKGKNRTRAKKSGKVSNNMATRYEGEDPTPLGVRSLLAGWTVGDDPRTFVFADPYGGETPEPPASPSQEATMPAITRGRVQNPPSVSQSQRAPVMPVVTPNRPFPTPLSGPVGISHSQIPEAGETWRNLLFADANEDGGPPGPATQPLPGPFGGRQGFKKKAKKRVGGF